MGRPPKPPIIAILSYNKVDLLRRCIDSIFANTKQACRICVVDQASTDSTKNYLRELGDGVDHLAPEKNLGFVLGNNLVMERYADRDILLLNNDTEVSQGWLEVLVERAYSDPQIGIVGAKLVFPDGRLQTAGGEIFSDASGREIGKYDDPDRYIYNQATDVDYVSGACLYVKRETLEKTGTFDPQFAPAYWEDTDLCFSARKAGYRVVYEPRAVVVHHEGGSFGVPDQRSRSADLQQRNKPKFIAKWRKELDRQRSNVFEIPPEEGKEKILVILPFLPLYDRAAGEMRWFHTLKILRERYQVVFLARNGQDGIKYINPLEEQRITVFHTDQARMKQLGCETSGPLWIDFPQLLQSNDFKAVIIGFYHVASQYYGDVRTYSPRSLLIIDSYDVEFLRERRRAEISGKDEDFWHAEEVKRIELGWYRKADMALTVTEKDREVLLREDSSLQVGISTDIHPVPPFEWKAGRKDLVFIGNFKHQPNEDAVVYFAEEILPLIHRELPDVRFYIVGNGPTPAVEALAGERVIVTGFVPDILPYLQESSVCVVPLRYGAGLKGKVGQAMAAGIPQVSTSIGAEGMGLSHERDILIADTPEGFAAQVIRLYGDEVLQRTLAENARNLVARKYSYESARQYWEDVFDAIDAGRATDAERGPRLGQETGSRAGGQGEGQSRSDEASTGYRRLPKRPEIVPLVSIVIPVCNNLALTESCWASIRKNTRIPYEILVIDNGSEEPVSYAARQNNYRCIRNEKNLGFAAAVNQGIQNTHGDYVVLLNNDCIVTPGWLERLLDHFEADARVGVVAPLTNYANNEQMIQVGYKDEEALYSFSEERYLTWRGRRRELPKVVGMCMAIPRRVIEETGLFDTRFGIGNFEDDDYCLRLRLAGYKVVCAQDVFIHHEGGATFRSMNVDYEALLKKNSEIFLQKWKPVMGPQAAVRETASPALTVVLYQEGDEVSPAEVRKTLGELPAGACVRILCRSPELFRSLEEGGVTIQALEDGRLMRQIDGEIRRASTPWVLVLSSGVMAEKGGLGELFEAATRRKEAGILVPRCNLGPAVQRVRPGYRLPEEGLEQYTEKNRKKNRGIWKTIQEPAGWCLLVKREPYLGSGGLLPEFRSTAGWPDLVRRMADMGWTAGCVAGSYVHFTPEEGGGSETDPVELQAVRSLADVDGYVAGGDLGAAVRCIEESLAHKPDYTRALHCRALILMNEGRTDEAENDLKTIETVNPGLTQAKNSLGCLAFEQGQDQDAERYFREALELEPGNREILRNLGDLYLSTRDFDKAMALYLEMVQRNPTDPATYLDLGDWFVRFGDRAGAEDWYRQALAVAPGQREAEERLAGLGAALPVDSTGGSSVH
ncbi:MAG: glycosyltransferase [Candidatus Eisenbacteria sp.]|nr:glycosyltransferase [Candidatus Eisenbacteria bacterium]